MPARSDARGAMNVGSHVTLVGHERCPGVEPHSHANWLGDKSLTSLFCRRQCAGSGRERYEERVALRVDFDAAVRGEGLTERAPVVSKRLRICLRTHLVQERG